MNSLDKYGKDDLPRWDVFLKIRKNNENLNNKEKIVLVFSTSRTHRARSDLENRTKIIESKIYQETNGVYDCHSTY